MYTNILIPTDGSELAGKAVAHDCGMVVAQQRHNVLCVGAFGEPGEPAKVAEQRGNLPAMAFELFLSADFVAEVGNYQREGPARTS
jgi:hypothetical protein